MAQYKQIEDSHIHSLESLEVIYGYDSFLDSLSVVTDMGCGSGLDLSWWANLQTRDDPPEPRNFLCLGVDKNLQNFDPAIKNNNKNIRLIEADFETKSLPAKSDLIWCHDSFQYVTNPLTTLKLWNYNMNENGMLILILKQNIDYEYNRYVGRTYSYQYFNYSLGNLIYMLAVNGFDCNDAYAYKEDRGNWLHLAVYKSNIAPMNPKETNLYDLADLGLLHPSVVDSLNKYNHIRHEDICYAWLDKDFYRGK